MKRHHGKRDQQRQDRDKPIALGAGIGMIFGAALGSPGTGMVLGAALGLSFRRLRRGLRS